MMIGAAGPVAPRHGPGGRRSASSALDLGRQHERVDVGRAHADGCSAMSACGPRQPASRSGRRRRARRRGRSRSSDVGWSATRSPSAARSCGVPRPCRQRRRAWPGVRDGSAYAVRSDSAIEPPGSSRCRRRLQRAVSPRSCGRRRRRESVVGRGAGSSARPSSRVAEHRAAGSDVAAVARARGPARSRDRCSAVGVPRGGAAGAATAGELGRRGRSSAS